MCSGSNVSIEVGFYPGKLDFIEIIRLILSDQFECEKLMGHHSGFRFVRTCPPTSHTVKLIFLYSTVSTLNPINSQLYFLLSDRSSVIFFL